MLVCFWMKILHPPINLGSIGNYQFNQNNDIKLLMISNCYTDYMDNFVVSTFIKYNDFEWHLHNHKIVNCVLHICELKNESNIRSTCMIIKHNNLPKENEYMNWVTGLKKTISCIIEYKFSCKW